MHSFVGACFHTSAPLSSSRMPSQLALAQHGGRAYHDVSIVCGHLDLLLSFPRADGGPFARLPWVVFFQPHVIGLLHIKDWAGNRVLGKGASPSILPMIPAGLGKYKKLKLCSYVAWPEGLITHRKPRV